MQNSSTQTNANPQTSDQSQQDVVKDICAKWSKFTHQDASAFKGRLTSCLRSQPSTTWTRRRPSVRLTPC